MHRSRTVRFAALGLAAGLTLGAASCASTVIDPSVTTQSADTTTTTIPTGDPAELLPRLLTEVGTLSNAIGESENKGEQMELIDNLWGAVRPAIAADDGVLVLSFDGMIELCHTGERLNHPADADKCFRNLTALSESYLDKYG